MKSVHAKFFVKSIHYLQHAPGNDPGGQLSEVKLGPVYGDGNESWSAATPQGEITMLITNPAAVDQFDLGREYIVEFTKA